MFKQSTLSVIAVGALAFGSLTACMVDDGTLDEEEIAVEEAGETGEVPTDEVAAEDAETAVADEDAEAEVFDEAVLDKAQASVGQGRACVDQSYASIQYVNIDSCGGWPCSCPSQLSPHAQFGRGHPVNVKYWCGPYVFVKDLWSTHYGWMREGALRNC
jgi:hypothetical protein